MAGTLEPCCEQARQAYVARMIKSVASYPIIKDLPCPKCLRIIQIRVYSRPDQAGGTALASRKPPGGYAGGNRTFPPDGVGGAGISDQESECLRGRSRRTFAGSDCERGERDAAPVGCRSATSVFHRFSVFNHLPTANSCICTSRS